MVNEAHNTIMELSTHLEYLRNSFLVFHPLHQGGVEKSKKEFREGTYPVYRG